MALNTSQFQHGLSIPEFLGYFGTEVQCAEGVKVAELIGVRALVCHAIDDEAKAFYLKHGFAESPLDPLTVLVGLR